MIIAVVMIINLYLQLTRADICYAFVSCWALAGIVRQQTHPQKLWPVKTMPLSSEIIHWANFAICFIIGASIAGLIRAFVNRNTPHKMRQKKCEWHARTVGLGSTAICLDAVCMMYFA